ncbi:hypothetical protein DFR29_13615 [Tahibacter aquaticus]|uniref:Signal recognition particle receptor subunit beta n=1 Tax=Tahibacter aquaticus TaxID=520092 RepID=A0A4R6YG83_9GAMM|nr:ATP/GTP-binding protein [Tahibacter aquaticus]TDR35364.1 hypothetical protein DFR29_13615 [Tahibacter aquaticus]
MTNQISVVDALSTKLVFVGPMGAGKTTAIASIADSPPVSTDMPMCGPTTGDKTSTTVAMDFATVRIGDGHSVFLYGCPGQDHFEFMRSILLQGAFGAIVVLNGADPEVVGLCSYWARIVSDFDASLPIVIGITRTDEVPQFDLIAVRKAMRAQGIAAPVFTFDARNRQQTTQLVRALLLLLE